MLRIQPRLKKGEELLHVLDTVQNHFWTTVRQRNIAYSVVHVQLCF